MWSKVFTGVALAAAAFTAGWNATALLPSQAEPVESAATVETASNFFRQETVAAPFRTLAYPHFTILYSTVPPTPRSTTNRPWPCTNC